MKYVGENSLKKLITLIKNKLDTKVDKEDGKGLSTNDYTADEKTKLAGIEAEANKYTLPVAGAALGGIKSGTDIAVDEGGNVSVGEGVVTSKKLADLAVTAAKIADGAVTNAKLSNGAVSTGKIASSAVTEAKIATGAVTVAKVNSDARTQRWEVSVSTTWTGDAAPYTQSIACSGMLATDVPKVYKIAPASVSDVDDYDDEFSKLYHVESSAGSITLYAKEQTTAVITVAVEVSRI